MWIDFGEAMYDVLGWEVESFTTDEDAIKYYIKFHSAMKIDKVMIFESKYKAMLFIYVLSERLAADKKRYLYHKIEEIQERTIFLEGTPLEEEYKDKYGSI
jgi:hypothetical protein